MSNLVVEQFSRQSLNASREWIDACVQWCRTEGGINNPNEIAKACQEQWLATDIRDEGVQISCNMPLNEIQRSLKFNWNAGVFVVQVLSAHDIGQPAYSQLQKINKIKDENSGVSAESAVNARYMAAWEPKAKRMLKFVLTCGSSGETFTAIESETLTQVVDPVKPGLKLKLIGPITCRRGSLMLKASNVVVLGGFVEALAADFSVQNLFKAILGHGANPAIQPQQSQVTSHPTGRFVPKKLPVTYKGSNLALKNQTRPVFQPKKPSTTPLALANNRIGDTPDVFDDDEDDLFANMEIPGVDDNQDVFKEEDDALFSQIDLGTPGVSKNKKRRTN